ncbi:MAG: universal stress protein [Betaproteobacteria bacterium]|nr:universal stress protein [Betaproteobacteria bacterium]
MLETILVTADASDQKHVVLLQAVEIARRFDARLHLVSVYDLNQLWETKIPESAPDIFESLEAESRRQLEDTRKQLEEWGIASQCHFLKGPVIDQIALLAEQIGADLLVMGHRQVSRLRRLLANSAAKGLVDRSPCSLMIVRESKLLPGHSQEPEA